VPSWCAGQVPLETGTNTIVVCGTNLLGWVGSDNVRLVRDVPEGLTGSCVVLILLGWRVMVRVKCRL